MLDELEYVFKPLTERGKEISSGGNF